MPASLPRRQVLLLGALAVALVAVVAFQVAGSRKPATAAGPRLVARHRAAVGEGLEPVPALKLAELRGGRPTPAAGGRNLFRDVPPPPPVQPAAERRRAAAPAPDPNAPPPAPPPPPPITLKFIGVVESARGAVAVFSDGRDVFYGREGDVIEGRYKIIRIGVESVEVSYVDGRGRQRIPLTG